MEFKNNVNLSEYTTFKMGGTALNFYIPETVEELVTLVEQLEDPCYFIGGGSNLLINNERIFENVVNLRKFNTSIQQLEHGLYKIGASVRLQKVIQTINNDGYGGIEYLYSVPGLLGGAICMNAGRGEKYKRSISDYLIEVEVLSKGERKTLKKEECEFAYRKSKFQRGDYIILSALFQFENIGAEKARQLCKERIEFCKKYQDNSKPNYGSVFCVSNKKIMKIFKLSVLGKKGGVRYSPKTGNWMLNEVEGDFEDAIVLLKRVEVIHKILGKPCIREVKIWE